MYIKKSLYLLSTVRYKINYIMIFMVSAAASVATIYNFSYILFTLHLSKNTLYHCTKYNFIVTTYSVLI